MSAHRPDTYVFVSSRSGPRLSRAERRLLEVMKALLGAGASVQLICTPRSPVEQLALDIGVEIAPYHLDRLNVIRTRSRIRKFLQRYRPLVVHSTGWLADYLVRWAAAPLSVPVVNTVHCVNFPPQNTTPFGTWLARRLTYSNLRRANAIVIDCQELRQPLTQAGVVPERIFYDPPSVDISRVEAEAAIPLASPLPGHPPYVGYAGSLEHSRGLGVLAQMSAILNLRHARATVVVAGDGPAERDLAEAIELRRIYRIAEVPSVPAMLQRFDICLFPSIEPGTPTTLLEAAAIGRPIVASSVAGIRSLFEEGDQVVLVPPGNANALAAAIASVLDDPASARRMGERARKRVADEYTTAASVGRHLELYSELAARR
jgi:glycosyltransferase involved in cell wall biosynthesis